MSLFLRDFHNQMHRNMDNLKRVKLPFVKAAVGDLALLVNAIPELVTPSIFSSLQVLWTSVVTVQRELTTLLALHRNHLSVLVGLLGELPYDVFLPQRIALSEWATNNRHELFQALETTKKPKLPMMLPHPEQPSGTIVVADHVELERLHTLFRVGLDDPEVIALCIPDAFPSLMPNLSSSDGLPLISVGSKEDFKDLMSAYSEYLEVFKAFDDPWIRDLKGLTELMEVLASAMPMADFALERFPMNALDDVHGGKGVPGRTSTAETSRTTRGTNTEMNSRVSLLLPGSHFLNSDN